MKVTMRTRIGLVIGAVLLASCGTSTDTSDVELQSILEGMSGGPCHEQCVSEALEVFDQCVRQGWDREKCFGRAIHKFYRCADDCSPPEPPTCEDRCERRARQVFQQCIARGGNEARCEARAREFLERCLEECEPPPCLDNSDCEERAYCAKDGCHDGPGMCTPRPEICPAVYAPVCGCDGNTYGNACEAAAAGVNVAREGECEPPSCLDNSDCEDRAYCAKDGCHDGPGMCTPRPEICPDVYAPVCGCDGNTYGNACEAAAAGVNVESLGECPDACGNGVVDMGEDCDDGNNVDGDGCNADCTYQFCGGIAGFPCPDGFVCVDDPRDMCDPATGGADCGGICVPDDGSCSSNAECAATDFCAFVPGTCVAPGACLPRPEACILIFDPVCGCDGETYGNACEAAQAGVSVAFEGQCIDTR